MKNTSSAESRMAALRTAIPETRQMPANNSTQGRISARQSDQRYGQQLIAFDNLGELQRLGDLVQAGIDEEAAHDQPGRELQRGEANRRFNLSGNGISPLLPVFEAFPVNQDIADPAPKSLPAKSAASGHAGPPQ